MAQYEEFTIDQGADVAVVIELIDPETNSGKNLGGFSVSSKMKRTYNSDSDDTHDFIATITDDENGIITLAMYNTETDNLRTGHYVYDVEISFVDSDANTIIERVLEGRIQVSPSVTR